MTDRTCFTGQGVREACNPDDMASLTLGNIDLGQALKAEQASDFPAAFFAVDVDADQGVALGDATALDPAYGDSADEIIVIDGRNLKLEGTIDVDIRAVHFRGSRPTWGSHPRGDRRSLACQPSRADA